MTTSEFVSIVAIVLLVGAFSGLMIALVRVNDSLRSLRGEMSDWRNEVGPLVDALRESTNEARSAVDEARQDLGRFDKVLGSAEAISEAVQGSARVTRVALSTPVIKVAALASGTSKAARRFRSNQEQSGSAESHRGAPGRKRR